MSTRAFFFRADALGLRLSDFVQRVDAFLGVIERIFISSFLVGSRAGKANASE